MLLKCCTQYASKFGKLSSGHRLEKVSFHPNPNKDNAKECSSYCTVALISHASKVMLKILQARLQQYMNLELPDVQRGFRKDSLYYLRSWNLEFWLPWWSRIPNFYLLNLSILAGKIPWTEKPGGL